MPRGRNGTKVGEKGLVVKENTFTFDLIVFPNIVCLSNGWGCIGLFSFD